MQNSYPFTPEELAEEEVKAILVLGILATLAVGLQIAGTHSLPLHLVAPPEWVRGAEYTALYLITAWFVTYIITLGYILAVKPRGRLLWFSKAFASISFGTGLALFAIGVVVYLIRLQFQA